MKRLNKKGFTLVELLAVIIILAVVVGITIPTVLSTTANAKEGAFKSASETAADWFERQYQSYMVGDETISPVNANFKTACGTAIDGDTDRDGTFTCAAATTALITATGLKPSNVAAMAVEFSAGRACVTLTSADGDYKTTAYGVGSTSIGGGGCSSLSKTTGINKAS